MKSVFSTFRLFSVYIIIVCVLSSCQSYLIINGNQHVPKKVTIHVSGYDTGTGHLTLLDDSNHPAETFRAYPGQKIRWKLDSPRNHKIDSIYEKAFSLHGSEIFADSPNSVTWSKSWKGKIKDSAALPIPLADSAGYLNYVYKIVWHVEGQIQHTFDPRIQIKPQSN